jgi:CMP-N,N'-diacetyllegionaminic acid synthase
VTIIAVIPARGGSKGVPKKNIKLLNGKPLIAYTIEQAINTANIEHVVVSTDCSEIASVATQYGAKVIFRPPEISGDLASSEDALVHCINTFKSEGCEITYVVFLQCTSPLREDFDIAKCLNLVLSKKFDSALSAVANHKFLWRVDKAGSAKPVNYDPHNRKMRQNIQEYQENGSIYVMKSEDLLNTKCRLNGKVGIHVMTEESGYEIDSLLDFQVIEQIMSRV